MFLVIINNIQKYYARTMSRLLKLIGFYDIIFQNVHEDKNFLIKYNIKITVYLFD